jgi:CspA family cold shock protein
MVGNVKWFNDKKGYGFITSENGEHFVHYKGIAGTGYKTLKKGQEVRFDLGDVNGRTCAINVEILK